MLGLRFISKRYPAQLSNHLSTAYHVFNIKIYSDFRFGGYGRPKYPSIWVKSLRPRQNGRHFPDDISKCIFLDDNVWISIKISQKFVPNGPINNIPALVQIMAWHRPGDKPLSEPMMVNLLTHIYVIRPQWVQMGYGRMFFIATAYCNLSGSHCWWHDIIITVIA